MLFACALATWNTGSRDTGGLRRSASLKAHASQASLLIVLHMMILGEVGAEGIGRPTPANWPGWSSPLRIRCSSEPAVAFRRGWYRHWPTHLAAACETLCRSGDPRSAFRTRVSASISPHLVAEMIWAHPQTYQTKRMRLPQRGCGSEFVRCLRGRWTRLLRSA